MIEKQDACQPENYPKVESKDRHNRRSLSEVPDAGLEKERKKEPEKEITKMIHIEVIGEDGEEMQVQMDSFPSPRLPPREESKEPSLRNNNCIIAELSAKIKAEPKQEKSQSESLPPEVGSRPRNEKSPVPAHVAEHQSHKAHKEKRPRSLNLGMATEFVYEKETDGPGDNHESDVSDEENASAGEDDDQAGQHVRAFRTETKKRQPVAMKMNITLNDEDNSVTAQTSQIQNKGKGIDECKSNITQESLMFDELKKQGENLTKMMRGEVASHLDAVREVADVGGRIEIVSRKEVTKMIMIDNDDTEEADRRNANKVTNDWTVNVARRERPRSYMFEETQADKSQKRKSTGSSHVEITRIVPLKPERSRSSTNRDEADNIFKPEEERKRLSGSFKREFISLNESAEQSTDINRNDIWPSSFAEKPSVSSPVLTNPYQAGSPKSPTTMGHNIFQGWEEQVQLKERTFVDDFPTRMPGGGGSRDDPSQFEQGAFGAPPFSPRAAGLNKNAPPTPPVKTKKARESGQILRNSRNPAKEVGMDGAAERRHAVTVLGIPSAYHSFGRKSIA